MARLIRDTIIPQELLVKATEKEMKEIMTTDFFDEEEFDEELEDKQESIEEDSVQETQQVVDDVVEDVQDSQVLQEISDEDDELEDIFNEEINTYEKKPTDAFIPPSSPVQQVGSAQLISAQSEDLMGVPPRPEEEREIGRGLWGAGARTLELVSVPFSLGTSIPASMYYLYKDLQDGVDLSDFGNLAKNILWRPKGYIDIFLESDWGKEFSEDHQVAAMAIGLGLEIFLDPLTYLSFGTSGLAKATGKGGKFVDDMASAGSRFVRKVGEDSYEYTLSPKGSRLMQGYIKKGIPQHQAGELIAEAIAAGGREAEELVHAGGWYHRGFVRGASETFTGLTQIASMVGGLGFAGLNKLASKVPLAGQPASWALEGLSKGAFAVGTGARNVEDYIDTTRFGWGATKQFAPIKFLDTAFEGGAGRIPVIGGAYNATRKVRQAVGNRLESTRIKTGDWVQRQNLKLIHGEMARHLDGDGRLSIQDREKYLNDMDWIKEVVGNDQVQEGGFISKRLALPLSNIAFLRTSGSLELDELVSDISQIEFEMAGGVGDFNREFIHNLTKVAEIEKIATNSEEMETLMTEVVHTAKLYIPEHTAGLDIRKAEIERDFGNLQKEILDVQVDMNKASAKATELANLQLKTDLMNEQVAGTLKNADLAATLHQDTLKLLDEAKQARKKLLTPYLDVIRRGKEFIEQTGYMDASNKVKYPVLDYLGELNRNDTARQTLRDFLNLFKDPEELDRLIQATAAPSVGVKGASTAQNIKDLTSKYLAYLKDLEKTDVLDYKMTDFADRMPRILSQEGKRAFSRALKKAGLPNQSGNVVNAVRHTLSDLTIKEINEIVQHPNLSLAKKAVTQKMDQISDIVSGIQDTLPPITGTWTSNQRQVRESLDRLTKKTLNPDSEVRAIDGAIFNEYQAEIKEALSRGEVDNEYSKAITVLRHIDNDFNYAVPSLGNGGKLFTDDLPFMQEIHGKQMTKYHTGKSLLYEAGKVFGKTAGEIDAMAPDELRAWYREQESYDPTISARAVGTGLRGALGATAGLLASEATAAWQDDPDSSAWLKIAGGLGLGMFMSPKMRKNLKHIKNFNPRKMNTGLGFLSDAEEPNTVWLREGYKWKEGEEEQQFRVQLPDGSIVNYTPEVIPLALKAFQDLEAGPAYRAQKQNELRKNYVGDGDQTSKTYIPVGRSREINISSNHSNIKHDGPLLPFNMFIKSDPDADGNFKIRSLEEVWYRDILGLDKEFKGQTASAKAVERRIRIGRSIGSAGETFKDHIKDVLKRGTFDDFDEAQGALNADTLGFNPEELFQSDTVIRDIIKKTEFMLTDAAGDPKPDGTLEEYQSLITNLLDENPYFSMFVEALTRPLRELRADKSKTYKQMQPLYTKYNPETGKAFTKTRIMKDPESMEAFFNKVVAEINPVGEGLIPINTDASRNKLWNFVFNHLKDLGDDDSFFPPDAFNGMWHMSEENPAWVLSLWRVFKDTTDTDISDMMLASGFGKHTHMNRYMQTNYQKFVDANPDVGNVSFAQYSAALVEKYRDAYRTWGKQNPAVLEDMRAQGYSGLREELDRPSTAFSLLLTMEEPGGIEPLKFADLTDEQRKLAQYMDVSRGYGVKSLKPEEMVGNINGLGMTVKRVRETLDQMVSDGNAFRGLNGYGLTKPLPYRKQGSVLNRWTTVPVIERDPLPRLEGGDPDAPIELAKTGARLGMTQSDYRVIVHPDSNSARRAEFTLNSDPYSDDTMLGLQTEYNMQEYGGKEHSIAPNEMLSDLLWETRPKIEDAPGIFQEIKRSMSNGDPQESYQYLLDRLVMSGNRFRQQVWDPTIQGTDVLTIEEYMGSNEFPTGIGLSNLLQARMNTILGPNFWGLNPPEHLRKGGATTKQMMAMAQEDLETLINQILTADPNIDPENFLKVLNEDTLDLSPDSQDPYRVKKLARYGQQYGYKKKVNNTFMGYLKQKGIQDTKTDPNRAHMISKAYIALQHIAMQPIKDNMHLSLSFNDTISFAMELLRKWDNLPGNKAAPPEDLGLDLNKMIDTYFPEEIEEWRREEKKNLIRPIARYVNFLIDGDLSNFTENTVGVAHLSKNRAYTKKELEGILKGVDKARSYFWDNKVHGDDVLGMFSKIPTTGTEIPIGSTLELGSIAAFAISHGLTPVSGRRLRKKLMRVITDGSNGVAQAFTESASAFKESDNIETGGLSSFFNTKNEEGKINAFLHSEGDFLKLGFTKSDYQAALKKKINIIDAVKKDRYLIIRRDEQAGVVEQIGTDLSDEDILGAGGKEFDPEEVKTEVYLRDGHHNDIHNDEAFVEESHLTSSLLARQDPDPYDPATRGKDYIPVGEEAVAIGDLPSGMRAVELVKENYRQNLKKFSIASDKGGVLIIDDSPVKPFEGTTFQQGRKRITEDGQEVAAPDIHYRRNKSLLEEVIDEMAIKPNVMIVTAEDLNFVIDGGIDEKLLTVQAFKIRDWLSNNKIENLYVGGSIEKHAPGTLHRTKILADTILSDDIPSAGSVGWMRHASEKNLPDEMLYGEHFQNASGYSERATTQNKVRSVGLVDKATITDSRGNQRYIDEIFFNEVQGWKITSTGKMMKRRSHKIQKSPPTRTKKAWNVSVNVDGAYWGGSGKAQGEGQPFSEQVDSRGRSVVQPLDLAGPSKQRSETRKNAAIISGQYERDVGIRDRALRRTASIKDSVDRMVAVHDEIVKQLEEIDPQKGSHQELKNYHINTIKKRIGNSEASLELATQRSDSSQVPATREVLDIEETLTYWKDQLRKYEEEPLIGDLDEPAKDYEALAKSIMEVEDGEYKIQLPESGYYFSTKDNDLSTFIPLKDTNGKIVKDTNDKVVYEHATPEHKAETYNALWEQYFETEVDGTLLNEVELKRAMQWITQNGHNTLVSKYMVSNPLKGNAGIDPGIGIGTYISKVIGDKNHPQHHLYREVMHDEYLQFFDRTIREDYPDEPVFNIPTQDVPVLDADGINGRTYKLNKLSDILRGVRNLVADKVARLRTVDNLMSKQLTKVSLEHRPVAFEDDLEELNRFLYHRNSTDLTDKGHQDGAVEAWALNTIANIGGDRALEIVEDAYFTPGDSKALNPFGKLYSLTNNNLLLDIGDDYVTPKNFVNPYVNKGATKQTQHDLNLVKKFMQEYTGDKTTERFDKLTGYVNQVEQNMQVEFRPETGVYPDLNKQTLSDQIAQGTKPTVHLDEARILNKIILAGKAQTSPEYVLNNLSQFMSNIIDPNIDPELRVASYEYILDALKRSRKPHQYTLFPIGDQQSLADKLADIAETSVSGSANVYRDEWLEVDRTVDSLLLNKNSGYEEASTNTAMVFRISDTHPNLHVRAIARNALIDASKRGAAQGQLGIGEQNDVVATLSEMRDQYKAGRKVFPDIPVTRLKGAQWHKGSDKSDYYNEITNTRLQNDPMLETRGDMIDSILDPDAVASDLPLDEARESWENDPRFKLRKLAQSLLEDTDNNIELSAMDEVTQEATPPLDPLEMGLATNNGKNGDGPSAEEDLEYLTQKDKSLEEARLEDQSRERVANWETEEKEMEGGEWEDLEDNEYGFMNDEERESFIDLMTDDADDIVNETLTETDSPADTMMRTTSEAIAAQVTEAIKARMREEILDIGDIEDEKIDGQASVEQDRMAQVQGDDTFTQRFEQEFDAHKQADIETLSAEDPEFAEAYNNAIQLNMPQDHLDVITDEARSRLAMRQAQGDDQVNVSPDEPITEGRPVDYNETEDDLESRIQPDPLSEKESLSPIHVPRQPGTEFSGQQELSNLLIDPRDQHIRQNLTSGPPSSGSGNGAGGGGTAAEDRFWWGSDAKEVARDSIVDKNGTVWSAPNVGAYTDGKWLSKNDEPVYLPSSIRVPLQRAINTLEDPKEFSKWERMKDTIAVQWKLNTLFPFPAFYMRNLLESALWKGYIAGNVDPLNYRLGKDLAHFNKATGQAKDRLRKKIGNILSDQNLSYSPDQILAEARKHKLITPSISADMLDITTSKLMGEGGGPQSFTQWVMDNYRNSTLGKELGSRLAADLSSKTKRVGTTARGSILREYAESAQSGATSVAGKLVGRERATKVVSAATKVGEGLNVATKLLTSPVRKPMQYARDFGIQMNDLIEDTVRFSMMVDGLRKGRSPLASIQYSEFVHFDYDKAEPIVQTLSKKAVPFIKWSRFNIPFMAKMKYGGEHQKFIPLFNAYEAMWKANPSQAQEFGGELLPQFMVDQNAIPVGENIDGDVHFILPGSILAQDGILRMMRRPQDIPDTVLNMLYPWHQFSYDFWKNVDSKRKRELVNYPGQTAPWLGYRIDKRLEHALRKTVRVANWLEKINPAIVPKLEDGQLQFKHILGSVKYKKGQPGTDKPISYRKYETGYMPWGTDSPAQKQYDKEGWLRTVDIINHLPGVPLQVFRFDPQRAEKSHYWKNQSDLAQLTKSGYGPAGWYNNITGDVGTYDDTFKGTKKEYKVTKQLAQTNDSLRYLNWLSQEASGMSPHAVINQYTGETYIQKSGIGVNPEQPELLTELEGGMQHLITKQVGLQAQLKELSNAQNVTSK